MARSSRTANERRHPRFLRKRVRAEVRQRLDDVEAMCLENAAQLGGLVHADAVDGRYTLADRSAGVEGGDGLETIHYRGCDAGMGGIGIEADGKIKGCPSLPTQGYTGGNVRDIDLTSIYYDTPELSFAREKRNVPHSFCGSCYYAPVCRGGCTWMSHSLFNRPGDNQYCHHRALELQRQGLRESVRQVEAAPGLSFDHGVFEIAVETADGDATDIPVPVDLTPRAAGVSATELVVCYSCFRHVFAGTTTCPFCAEDVAASHGSYQVTVGEAREAAAKLASLLTAR